VNRVLAAILLAVPFVVACDTASTSETPEPTATTSPSTRSESQSPPPKASSTTKAPPPSFDEEGQPVRVRFGKVEVAETSEEAARKKLEAEQTKLGACYQQYRSTHDQGTGRYTITAVIDENGEVTAAMMDSTDFEDADAFGACLVTAISTIAFGEVDAAGGKVTAHMVFEPKWPRTKK
jgi:hypothetical protein